MGKFEEAGIRPGDRVTLRGEFSDHVKTADFTVARIVNGSLVTALGSHFATWPWEVVNVVHPRPGPLGVVRDREGDAWIRSELFSDVWVPVDGAEGDAEGWGRLNEDFGPLTVIFEGLDDVPASES